MSHELRTPAECHLGLCANCWVTPEIRLAREKRIRYTENIIEGEHPIGKKSSMTVLDMASFEIRPRPT